MNNTYELPPILSGSAEQQLRQLRDYLVRLAQELPTEAQLVTDGNTASGPSGATAPAGAAGGTSALADAPALRALVVKTADRIYASIDALEQSLAATYLARSDFGVYRESVDAQIETTARGVVESYELRTRLDALDGGLALLAGRLEGELRRGLITDPETGETVLGIAVAQTLSFTDRTVTEGGAVYRELSPGQTLGLYTSTGWQFWINGSRRGWFDSTDGMLHVSRIVAESELKLGADWLATGSGGFGLRYMGD